MTSHRRDFLRVLGTLAVGSAIPAGPLLAQQPKLRVGMMLPYTGTFAALGTAITNAFKLAVNERGGRLGGREIEYFTVDDESDPAKAPENTNRLVQRDKVDVIVGTVHSGVLMGMVKVVRESGTLLVCPNAGAGAATGAACSPNFFRTSFSNWQTTYPLGKVLMDKGQKSAVFITWNYAAGTEMLEGFKEAYTKHGGKLVRELLLPFPQVEFQALLTEAAAIRPSAVVAFFAGGGAAKFLRDYAAAGLKGRIPLYGSGFLTDGVLEAVGDSAEGVETTLHYGDGLSITANNAFRVAYVRAYGMAPDVYAVQGYDAALLLSQGLDAVKGDVSRKKELIAAMEKAKIDSPRGAWTMSRAHNPIQDFYLRKVVGKENLVVGVAHKALADPARGCKMA
jgi:branched-chain amino acid transport system substrate-binding protein